jgi:hypothetical protein
MRIIRCAMAMRDGPGPHEHMHEHHIFPTRMIESWPGRFPGAGKVSYAEQQV